MKTILIVIVLTLVGLTAFGFVNQVITAPMIDEGTGLSGGNVRSVTISRGLDGDMRVTARMSYSTKAIDSIMQWLKDDGSIEEMTLYIQQ